MDEKDQLTNFIISKKRLKTNEASYKELLLGKPKRNNNPEFHVLNKLILKKKIQVGKAVKKKDQNDHVIKYTDNAIQKQLKKLKDMS